VQEFIQEQKTDENPDLPANGSATPGAKGPLVQRMNEMEITVSGLQNSYSGGFVDIRRLEESMGEQFEATMAKVATMADSLEDMEEYIAEVPSLQIKTES